MTAVAGEAEPLTDREVDEAIALWQAAGLVRPWNDPRADFARAIAGAGSVVLGLREQGCLIATVMAGEDGHRGWLYYLAVAADRRGAGLGRTMVAAAEAWLRTRGVPAVRLMVRGDNHAATGFYAALGYEPSDVVVMGRRLQRD